MKKVLYCPFIALAGLAAKPDRGSPSRSSTQELKWAFWGDARASSADALRLGEPRSGIPTSSTASRLWLTCCLLAGLLSGCTTRSSANAQAQAAFAAGQQQATAREAMGPTVSFRGDVKKTSVPWTEGLTLAQALLAAEYKGLWDPHTILVIRKGERFQVDAKRFLRGLEDPQLEPGDTVEVHR